MEAVKTIVGKEGYLKDLAMTWPLVIPKNADEPTATTVFLRFCQQLFGVEGHQRGQKHPKNSATADLLGIRISNSPWPMANGHAEDGRQV